jgi:hypothetical protein
MISLETERQIRREWALRAERMQPAPQQRPPFHPDYGLPQPHRLKVLHLADQTNPATAAETYNVGVSTIYKWRVVMRSA